MLSLFLLSACASPVQTLLSGLEAVGQGAEWCTYISVDAAYAFEYAATAHVTDSTDASQPYRIVYVQFVVTDTAAYQGASIVTLPDAAPAAEPAGDARAALLPGRPGSGVWYRIALFGGGAGGDVEPSPQALAQYEHLLATFRALDQPLQTRAVRAPAAAVEDASVTAAFEFPMRDAAGANYGVPEGRIEQSVRMEQLGYGTRNLDQWRIKCFDVDWSRMLHAGEDWYRLDTAMTNTAGAPVYAVADGVVVRHNSLLSYPGNVVVIWHRLPDGSDIYSMYGHVADVRVVVGEVVTRGQQIAVVFDQGYRGRTPELHPVWDSHLHFELRRRADMGNIYEAGTNAYGYDYPKCTWLYPGRGYTFRIHPNDYPYPGDGYVAPSAFIAAHTPVMNVSGERVLLPLVQREPAIACANVLVNSNFEAEAGWAGLANTEVTVYSTTAYSAVHVHGGARSGRVGSPEVNGYWSEILQTVQMPAEVVSATLTVWRYLDTAEISTRTVYDAFRIGLETDGGVELVPPLRIDNAGAGRGEWVRTDIPIDVARLSGRGVWVTIKGATDSTLPSSLYVDDVELIVCGRSSE
ncbi:MAG: M23 family metallopeptidase [Chloroflexi bacterium]|nr:M23 family metallopeptidase [Chloroflexota bacterium]